MRSIPYERYPFTEGAIPVKLEQQRDTIVDRSVFQLPVLDFP